MVIEVTVTEGLGALPDDVSGTDEKDVNQKKIETSVDFEPNLLDDFDISTYHFRLFMMSPGAIKAGAFGPESREERIVIAESGANTIGIDDVSVTSYPGPSRRYGAGISTAFRFTLQQPLGANLLDLIFSGAKRLGIENIGKIPFFLELSFRGRNPDRTLGGVLPPGGEQFAQLGEDKLKDIVWVWPIYLTNMVMDVNSGGSTYTMTAALYEQLAVTNQAADLEKSTTIAASTVNEFFVGLEAALTAKEENKKETNNTQAIQDTYTFYIDQEISKSKIVSDEAKVVDNASGEYNQENTERNEFTFSPGTSIEKITETILSNTEYFQTRARGVTKRDVADEEGNKEKAVLQTYYRIFTDTQLGDFDKIRNDYARHFRYLIVPYEMTTIQSQTNRNANVGSQQRYDIIKNKGRIRKSYNYIYTGLNDQVFDFDLTFNFNWHVAEPFMAGITQNAQFQPTGAAAKLDEDAKVDEKSQKQSLSEQFGLDPDSGLGEFVDDTSDFIQSDAVIGGITEGIATGDFDQLTGSASEFLAANVAKGVRIAGSNVFPNFVQDTLTETDPVIEDETVQENNMFDSVTSYLESDPGTDNRISGGDSESPGKTLLTSMFEQAKSPVAADLLDLSLRIKGDPYWLEPSAVGRTDGYKTHFDTALERYNVVVNRQDPDGNIIEISASANTEVTSVNSTEGQVYFLFRSFTPQEASAETGLTPGFGANNVLNGVYAVRTIEHSFSGGQFTQQVDAVRDLRIDTTEVNFGVGVGDLRGFFEQFSIESVDAGTAAADAALNNANQAPPAFNTSTGETNGEWWEQSGGSGAGTGNA